MNNTIKHTPDGFEVIKKLNDAQPGTFPNLSTKKQNPVKPLPTYKPKNWTQAEDIIKGNFERPAEVLKRLSSNKIKRTPRTSQDATGSTNATPRDNDSAKAIKGGKPRENRGAKPKKNF